MEEKPRKRRRFQFSLKTLFVLVTVCALGFAWIGWQVKIVSHRKALRAILKQRNKGLGGLPSFTNNNPTLPFYRVWLGDHTTGGVYLDRNAFSDDEVRQFKEAFPEIEFIFAQDAGFRPDPVHYP